MHGLTRKHIVCAMLAMRTSRSQQYWLYPAHRVTHRWTQQSLHPPPRSTIQGSPILHFQPPLHSTSRRRMKCHSIPMFAVRPRFMLVLSRNTSQNMATHVSFTQPFRQIDFGVVRVVSLVSFDMHISLRLWLRTLTHEHVYHALSVCEYLEIGHIHQHCG